MTREELIEAMARALCLTATDTHTGWEHYKPEAVEVLAAIEAAGVRLVPVEATKQMLLAAHMVESDDIELTEDEHRAMYAAFVAASPYAPPGG